jgi:hypothetical protein
MKPNSHGDAETVYPQRMPETLSTHIREVCETADIDMLSIVWNEVD